MKKLRCKKELGTFYHISNKEWNDGEQTTIYTLYDSNKIFVSEFWGYSEMMEYINNGNKLL